MSEDENTLPTIFGTLFRSPRSSDLGWCSLGLEDMVRRPETAQPWDVREQPLVTPDVEGVPFKVRDRRKKSIRFLHDIWNSFMQ